MLEQLSLFEQSVIVQPEYDEDDTIEARFEKFHEANPHVARKLTELALRLRRAGRTRYGIAALFEVLRFDYALQTNSDDWKWKLNNNFRSRYARMLMETVPELADFFETRKLTAN